MQAIIPDTQLVSVELLLKLGDDALILGHRNSEWCGHGPVLEQDIAISNISLDLIGQARNFYQYAAERMNAGEEIYDAQPIHDAQPGNDSQYAATAVTEDSIAFLRAPSSFRNCLLAEQPRGDWAFTIVRQFLFSTVQYEIYQQLQTHPDLRLAAIAAKSLKEVTYHLRWSSEWVIRLGDGTEESHRRMIAAQEQCRPLLPGLLQQYVPNYEQHTLPNSIESSINSILEEATLPGVTIADSITAGKDGIAPGHSVHLTELLTTMQALHRAHPGATW